MAFVAPGRPEQAARPRPRVAARVDPTTRLYPKEPPVAASKSKVLSPVEPIGVLGDDPNREGAAPGGRPARRETVGRRWRLRRNLVIYIANQHGASQRMLADVFDLPHSRIAAIVKELREQYGSPPPRTPA